ncbi:major facilitator superfamily domain-containing protein [Coniochaeta sp. 2T2.1]|nr:major facilitator superfamily domain-containing protein [Coniochaeta sp. 2T2.1]
MTLVFWLLSLNPRETVDAPSLRDISGPRWVIVVLSILSSTFLFALDNTVVADVQPRIVLQFAAVDKLAWLSVAFIMAAVSTNLLFGQLYSQLAVCGAAPNMDTLIVGRALCGLGGSGMYLGVLSLIAATTTVQERPLYVGGIGLTWGLGTILGPLVGGAFAESAATWRWAFYINLVVGAVIIPIYFLLLPSPDPQPNATTLRGRLREIDFLGAALMLGSITTFVVAINFGGTVYPWSSALEITLFLVSEAYTLLFGFQQWLCLCTTPTRRLLPMEILTGESAQTTLIMFCTTAAGGAGIFVPVYFIPLFFQFTRGDDPVRAAVRLLPFILFGVVVTLGQGALLSHKSGRFGLYMAWFLAGGVLATVGGVLMYMVTATSSDAWVCASSSLLGAGVGMFSQAGFSVAQASNDEALGSKVAAFIALGQTGGITLSLAIANSVFINEATRRLGKVLGGSVNKEQIDAAIAGIGSDFFEKMGPETMVLVLDAVVEAMRKVYILVIVAGALVVALSFWMRRERLFISATAVGA